MERNASISWSKAIRYLDANYQGQPELKSWPMLCMSVNIICNGVQLGRCQSGASTATTLSHAKRLLAESRAL